MKVCVIDASVVVKWLVKEEYSAEALQLLYGEATLIAPELIFAETANALWKMQRRRELDVERMEKAVNTLRFSPVYFPVSMQELSTSASRIAAELDHAVYDCYYLALAVRSKCTLITADKRLLNKVRDTVRLAVRILHVSQAANELGLDSDAESMIHEPMAMPFESEVIFDRSRLFLDEQSTGSSWQSHV